MTSMGMTDGGTKQDPIRNAIRRYVCDLDSTILSVDPASVVEVLEVSYGAYNLNYHIRVGEKNFLFRINVERQSGLSNQIQYEFDVLRFLENRALAPKVYHADSTCISFDYDILIEEFLIGSRLSLQEQNMPAVAELLVRLHSIRGGQNVFIKWPDPFQCLFASAQQELGLYTLRPSANVRLVKLGERVISLSEPLVRQHRNLFSSESINHTDVAPDNFILTPSGPRLIDWEKPRIDDFTYDLSHFLCDHSQMWGSDKLLSPEAREVFLDTYIGLSKQDEELVRRKVAYRIPLVSLRWAIWASNHMIDLDEHRTTEALRAAHEARINRYRQISDPANLERLLDTTLLGCWSAFPSAS